MGMTLSTTAGTGLPLTMNQLEAFNPTVFEEDGPYEVLAVIAGTYGVRYELATYHGYHPEEDDFAAVLFAKGAVTAYDADVLRFMHNDSDEALQTLTRIANDLGVDSALIGEYVVTFYG